MQNSSGDHKQRRMGTPRLCSGSLAACGSTGQLQLSPYLLHKVCIVGYPLLGARQSVWPVEDVMGLRQGGVEEIVGAGRQHYNLPGAGRAMVRALARRC